ncbi:hypothetical protein ABIA30_001588 [Mycobacterium sp. MAA66]|uniref:hypothetical protein n=1 Tax=Mycobacterium sp. MAA66 TaxID=3156297 RepID=UPI003518420C
MNINNIRRMPLIAVGAAALTIVVAPTASAMTSAGETTVVPSSLVTETAVTSNIQSPSGVPTSSAALHSVVDAGWHGGGHGDWHGGGYDPGGCWNWAPWCPYA